MGIAAETRYEQSDRSADADVVRELKELFPPILTTGQVADMLQCTEWDVRNKAHSGEIEATRWGNQFRYFRQDVIAALKPYPADADPAPETTETVPHKSAAVNEKIEDGPVDYDQWYPEVPAVMNTRQLADLLGSSDQMIRSWTRNGIIPGHQSSSGRKLWYLRHEIFDWLIACRYEPSDG